MQAREEDREVVYTPDFLVTKHFMISSLPHYKPQSQRLTQNCSMTIQMLQSLSIILKMQALIAFIHHKVDNQICSMIKMKI